LLTVEINETVGVCKS